MREFIVLYKTMRIVNDLKFLSKSRKVRKAVEGLGYFNPQPIMDTCFS